jgi:hypothetical protein
MTAALLDAPGVTTQYNWFTDIGGAVDPNSLSSVQLPASYGANPYNTGLIWFTLQLGIERAVTLNQLGIMGGPLVHANGQPNVGGVVTLALMQGFAAPSGYLYSQIATASVDLTDWVPGQFYWSDPLPNPITLPSYQGAIQYYYYISAICSVPYSVYTARPCTLRYGTTWGSVAYRPGFGEIPASTNNHLCFGGPVDVTLNNYVDLSTGSIAPTFALSGAPQRMGGLEAPLVPQIELKGRFGRAGVFEGDNNMIGGKFVLSASIAGGPLWKPARLCTG